MSGQIYKMTDQNKDLWKDTCPVKEEKLFMICLNLMNYEWVWELILQWLLQWRSANQILC